MLAAAPLGCGIPVGAYIGLAVAGEAGVLLRYFDRLDGYIVETYD